MAAAAEVYHCRYVLTYLEVAVRYGAPLELLEAAHPEERLAEDEKRPALADHAQRVADGAVVACPVRGHVDIVAF